MKPEAIQAALEVLRNPECVYSAHEYRRIIGGLIGNIGPFCETCQCEGRAIRYRKSGGRRYECKNGHRWSVGMNRPGRPKLVKSTTCPSP